ncbi:MAG: UPF0182 family membrane protein [Nocardioidaceae bacterium]
MADDFDGDDEQVAEPARRLPSGRRVVLPTVLTLVALLFVGAVFTGLWTDRLWFQSVGYSGVFTTVLVTRAVLFVLFGGLFALVVAGNVVAAYRNQPVVVPRARRLDPVTRYREVVDPIRKRLLAGVSVLLGLIVGMIAAGQWQHYLLWRHGVDFGYGDEYFHKDIGFFVFDYPWIRFVLSYGFAVLAVSIVAVALVNYVYGGITLQTKANRVTSAAQVHLSVLLGLFVLLKAVAYWLDRYGMALSPGSLITGITYTDAHARIPAKNILMVIAVICAVLFFANAFRRSWLLPGIGLGLLVLSSLLIGGIWPAIMQSFQVKPSEPDKESPYIAKNITATRKAYGVDGVQVEPYNAQTTLSKAGLASAAESIPGTRLLDPTLVSPAFEQLQQVRGYYQMQGTLDVDRYVLAGSSQPQDVVIGARELNLDGLPSTQRNWPNDHTVYTHGYGVVAARGNQRGADGKPVWVVQNIPLKSSDPTLHVDQPRIYFGEQEPDYSIVGGPNNVEVDTPAGPSGDTTAADTSSFTYDGLGGVSIGNWFTKAMYAVKFADTNMLLSDRVNSASRILYDREPRARVEKVAPWLTVDGNTYPAVVDGRIVWIVDAYTTSSSYPLSQLTSLNSATSDTLTDRGSYAALPNDQINYMRNSVKAVVDAYDGTVTLYAWDESDPILQAWESVFPGVVQPKADIPPDLLAHLRYPEDLFKVQRDILARYHVTDAQTFYKGGEKWLVPEDPTSTTTASQQPPYYLSVQTPGQRTPDFSLTSVFVPNARQNLAAFVSVNSNAADHSGDGYGTFKILELPSDTQVPGPGQMSNQISADEGVASALFNFKQNGTQVLLGNLLTLPVGQGLLYVQPVYTQSATTQGSYPVLQYVIASFGSSVGFGRDLNEALDSVLGITTPGGSTGTGSGNPSPGGGGTDATVAQLLNKAAAAYQAAQAALAKSPPDLGAYQRAIVTMNDYVTQAQDLLAKQSAGTPPTPSPSVSPSSSPPSPSTPTSATPSNPSASESPGASASPTG